MSEAERAEWLLEARGLALGYRGRAVLRDVDWTVRVGERWFLLGPNGSGKTTLLRAVLGLLRPLRGTLERRAGASFLAQVGFVPQHALHNPTLPVTVREFVSLGAVGLGGVRRGRERLAWALERTGLSGLADRDLRALSGGQRRRALVARALVRRPRLLVLDEPTEGLDVAAEEAFVDTVSQLHRDEPLTLLFVTHELRLAARLATHVALFGGGGVRAGTREEVLVASELEAALGLPPAGLPELRS